MAAQRGIPAERQGRGIAEQVALALRTGRITEYEAALIAQETACLSREDRIIVDATISGDPARVEAMGDQEAAAEARKLVAELDAGAVAERRRRAEADRHVSIRPPPTP